MALFNLFKSGTPFLNQEESNVLASVIQACELKCSGEIRVYIESRCPTMDPSQRAQVLFNELGMYKTDQRNGVLIYIAHIDHEFSLIADRGIYQVSPTPFWSEQAKLLALAFREKNHIQGLKQCIESIADLMALHFPPSQFPNNELPDEIIFGQ